MEDGLAKTEGYLENAEHAADRAEQERDQYQRETVVLKAKLRAIRKLLPIVIAPHEPGSIALLELIQEILAITGEPEAT